MGVSGSGKTTIGRFLSQELRIPFFDADDFHPKKNIDKMTLGIPLNDNDREPWLKNLNNNLLEWDKNKGAILACSALKESYRRLLEENLTIIWIYLQSDFDTIFNRLKKRENHFMPPSLLKSQFESLEVPNYGLHLSANKHPKVIIKKIKEYMSNNSSKIGVFGLGVMGKSLAFNLLNHNISTSVYNRETKEEQNIVPNFLTQSSSLAKGFTNVKDFVESLESPKKIILMVPAGEIIDQILKDLSNFLEEGDIVIDGGNSHFLDTQRRIESLALKNIHLIGMGISGGEEGAKKGPSLMPGGSLTAYEAIAPILKVIAAKDKNNQACFSYIGKGGSGHFVKMVHNGIEYGEMQLLAEMFALLSKKMSYDKISELFSSWNQGYLSNYLLEITSLILKEKNKETYVLDSILDKAASKGTGAWSSIASLTFGVTTPTITSSVFARYLSSLKEKRNKLSSYKKFDSNADENLNTDRLKEAYAFARTLNLHQGLELIKEASNQNGWNINLPEVLRVWSNGCIIKSKQLEGWKSILETSNSLLKDNSTIEELYIQEPSIVDVLSFGLKNRISLPSFSSTYQYWVSITTEKSTANLIQAQRDFFGAHTFVNIHTGKTMHYKWTKL